MRDRRHIENSDILIETRMTPIETMSWTAWLTVYILNVAGLRILPEAYVFPRCANSECSASFGNFREGTFFRFRRTDSDSKASAKHHAVEHAWLCTRCSEHYTLEHRENKTILAALVPAMPLIEVPGSPVPLRKRTRSIRRRRRPSSRRSSAQPPTNSPLVVLAITPRSDFERS